MPDASTSPRAGHVAPTNGARFEALTTADLLDLTGGRLVRDSYRPVRGAAVDSRRIRPGELFVALPGERTDGHRYLGEAVRSGAAALLVSAEPGTSTLAQLGDVTIVQVPDTLAGLQALAAGWRDRFQPVVVGVTGSIAKTSTKEAVATVLSALGQTLRTEGNQNNEIGVPLALLRLTSDDRHAVLEMGMYTGGEIARLAQLARPRIGVVTAVLGVHLSRAGTIEAVERAKAELVEALPQDGFAILNADDPRVLRMRERTAAQVITYGFDRSADVSARRVRSSGADGMRFQLRTPSPDGPVMTAASIPTLGRLSVHNALAAAAVGIAVGMAPAEIVESLASGWSAPHRGQLVRVGGLTIVDDSYNASPASMLAALDTLAGLPGRRVAVLGEMLELGDGAAEGHHAVGRAAARTCSLLVTIGLGAAGIARGAEEAGLDKSAIVEVVDREAALAELRSRLAVGDVVLIKASRGAELDLLVSDLQASLA